jgi:ATP-dependent Clp protease protease subunit
MAQLLHLESEDPEKDIYLYINSPGGSITSLFAIYDTMTYIKPDVATVCMGLAASAGAVILAGGTKGKRYSLPHARIMLHQPEGGAEGTSKDIEIQAKLITDMRKQINGLLAEFTGQDIKKITADTDRDFWMKAQEALDYGIVDEVLSRRNIEAKKE